MALTDTEARAKTSPNGDDPEAWVSNGRAEKNLTKEERDGATVRKSGKMGGGSSF